MDPENIGRSEITTALARNDHKIGEAANDLGIDRRTLMRRMRVLGMAKGTPGRRYKPLHRRSKRRYLPAALAAVATLGAIVLVKKGSGA